MAVNVLMSYAFHAKTDVAAVRANLVCGRILIDSGAFTARNTGKPIQLPEYAEYLETWRGAYDHAVTLDVIGDPVATAANTRALHERGIPVMPVFTRGATLADFDAMVADSGYVCVGGMVGSAVKDAIARLGMLQRRAADNGGGIHALGVGSLAMLRAIRPYSADASSISATFKYGVLAYFNGRAVVATSLRNRAALLKNWQHIRAHDIDVGALALAGRFPPGHGGALLRILEAMSWAYVAADEYVKTIAPAIPPAMVADTVAGPHLYNSLLWPDGPLVTAGLDQLVHHGGAPSVWRVHGSEHRCRIRA
jgi:hypothetical protein